MGVRARIIDRLTDAVRAPREVARLRAECERLRKALSEVPAGLCCMSCDRDDRRHGARSVVVANPACDACMLRWAESELVRVRAERDARISTDIDGAQAWLVARGWWFEREDASPVSEPWSAYRDTAAEPVLVADTYWRAVLHALGEELSDAWDSAPDPEDDA